LDILHRACLPAKAGLQPGEQMHHKQKGFKPLRELNAKAEKDAEKV
jgi:hypothetical protein